MEERNGGVLKEPLTAASTIYHAVGILETEQETIIATRNAQVVQTKFLNQQVRLLPSTKELLDQLRMIVTQT